MIEDRRLTHNRIDIFFLFPNPGCQWQVKMWSFWRVAVLEAPGLEILKFADISLRAPSFERPAAVSSESSAHKRVVQQRNDPNLQKAIQNMLHPAINKYEKRMSQSHILNHNQNAAANKSTNMYILESPQQHAAKQPETSWNIHKNPPPQDLQKPFSVGPPQPPLPHGGVPATWRWGCRGTLPKALGGFRSLCFFFSDFTNFILKTTSYSRLNFQSHCLFSMWFSSDFDKVAWSTFGLDSFEDAVEGKHTESTAPRNHMVSYAKALADLAAKPPGKPWGWGCRGWGGRRRFGGGGSHLGSHLTWYFAWLSWLTFGWLWMPVSSTNKKASQLNSMCFCDGDFLKFRQVGEAPDTCGVHICWMESCQTNLRRNLRKNRVRWSWSCWKTCSNAQLLGTNDISTWTAQYEKSHQEETKSGMLKYDDISN